MEKPAVAQAPTTAMIETLCRNGAMNAARPSIAEAYSNGPVNPGAIGHGRQRTARGQYHTHDGRGDAGQGRGKGNVAMGGLHQLPSPR